MVRVWYCYKLTSPALHVGDRFKGGIYKPTVDYLRATTITFALRRYLSTDEIYAFGGRIKGLKKVMVRNPHDRKIAVGRTTGDRGPIQIEYFENAECDVYVNRDIGNELMISVGGFKSLGMGISVLSKVSKIESGINTGYLITAIPLEWKDVFEIRREIASIYGYLFMPENIVSGSYVKSLMPGSFIAGLDILVIK